MQIQQTVTQLQALGVEATRMGSYGYNHALVVERFVKVRMSDDRLLQQHGPEIGRLLRSLPRVELDFESALLTEAEMIHFEDVKVVMARLSKSSISDEGLKLLANSGELIFLEADETTVTDAGLEALRGSSKLRFAFLRQSQVTPVGRQILETIPTLEVTRL
jgi:hypothetical protein